MPGVVDVDVEPVLMGDVRVHRPAALVADVADDDARRPRVRGAIGVDHGNDRADRALVPVQPPRRVRDRVRDRVPGDPVGPSTGNWVPSSRLPLHRRPTDVALRHSIVGDASALRDRFGFDTAGRLRRFWPVCVSTRNVRLGGSSAMTLAAPAPLLRNSAGGTIAAGNRMSAVARARRRRLHASRRWREAASPTAP